MKKIGLMGILFFGLILGGCGNDTSKIKELEKTIDSLKTENSILRENNDIPQEEKEEAELPENNNTDKKYALGETIELGNNKGKAAEIKIIEVTTNQSAFPEHMINLDDYDTKKMVAVKIEYKNIAFKEAFLPYSNYFQAFDESGKALTQVNQQNGQDAVGQGRTGVTQLFWELPIEGSQFNKMEIDFVPANQKVATFSLDVKH